MTGSMKLCNYDTVIALQANQHNYQNTKDGLYKNYNYYKCDCTPGSST